MSSSSYYIDFDSELIKTNLKHKIKVNKNLQLIILTSFHLIHNSIDLNSQLKLKFSIALS